MAREVLSESGIEPHQQPSSACSLTTTNNSDQSILIDPRQSLAYNNRDENFQVLESEYIKNPITHTSLSPSPKSCTSASESLCTNNSSSLLNFPKNKSSFFEDYTSSPNKKQLQSSSSKYFKF